MSRRPSPRPEYDRAAAIPHAEAVLHLWGDEESGYVGDRIYVSSGLIHLIEFSLRPRARFTHSEDNRTIFAADEVLHVTEGEMLLVNPETGEAVLAREGESVFFRRDTWHHAVNRSNDRPLRVMELFAPPPSTGASSAYARTRPYLSDWRYGDDRWLGRWPMDRAERDQSPLIPPDRRIRPPVASRRLRRTTCWWAWSAAPSTSPPGGLASSRDRTAWSDTTEGTWRWWFSKEK